MIWYDYNNPYDKSNDNRKNNEQQQLEHYY